jgi:hypothetical protein
MVQRKPYVKKKKLEDREGLGVSNNLSIYMQTKEL